MEKSLVRLVGELGDASLLFGSHTVKDGVMTPRPVPLVNYDERHLAVLRISYDGRIPMQYRIYCAKCAKSVPYSVHGYDSPYAALAAAKERGHNH